MKTIAKLDGAWRVVRDPNNGNKLIGLAVDALTPDGAPVQVQVEWTLNVDEESGTGLVDVGVWDSGDHVASLDSSCVAVPLGADANVIHCAVLVGLALVGLTDIAPIAQATAFAVETAHGKAPLYASLTRATIEWLNDQRAVTCPVCNKPFVTIEQAVILEKVDGHRCSGGEAWCWGRGACAKRIIADELARRDRISVEPIGPIQDVTDKPSAPSANDDGSAETTS